MRKALFGITALGTLCLPAMAAARQDDGPAEAGLQSAGDIVVTARRREEKLQDVPIAVSAVDASGLDSRGLGTVTQIGQIAPNIQFTPGQGGNSGAIAPFIRGVGENDFIITSDPAVGVYIDGVYVARTFGAMTELLGIDRVEVLRGPQGTLFGKNTAGGAINIVSAVPGQQRKIEADLRYGSFNTVRARLYAETPLSGDWSLGVAALGEFGEGWQKVPSGKNLGNRNVVGGKAALHHDGATLDALLQIDGLRRRQHAAPHSMIAFTPTFLSDLQSAFLAPCCAVPDHIDRTDGSPALNRDETDAFNAALTLTADLGGATLKSITAYRHVEALFGRDGDASAAIDYAGDVHDEKARQISQEVQLALDLGNRGTLLLGAFVYREKTRDDTRLVVADGLYPALIAAGFDPALATALDLNIDFRNRQRTDNLALFANGNYELADGLSLELGARYTWEKKKFSQSAMRLYSGQPLLAGTPYYELEKSWDAFTPRASLSYKMQPGLMAYASFSRGFRSGGFNGRPTSLEEVGSYDPEYLTAYEAGIKASFGRIATVNLAVFRNSYKDQQILVSTVSPDSGLLIVRNENAGRSRIQGLELEGMVRVSPGFTLSGALGLLDAKYLDYVSVINGVPTDVSDRKPKQAPDITANLGAAYETPLGDALDGLFRVDIAYKSEVHVDTENTALLRQPDHAIVNASAEFRLTGTGLSLRAGVDNITDKRIITAGYDASTSFGFTEAYYSPPRRYSLTLAYRH
ncbi:TonB-dependent receptor [Sphingobium jiangsuense]|uniref:Iron complex outermembrane receptor protein n=1 Tax=Sphingobium jiangsuense TaxID=870476 RepID=A0A7W6BJ60_9SPHN|nr:TonB-dependent receptor [Sphingobium jiangsuense]MBB3926914.1 iron complex outermembrane receptor protein [Sphingobium jiangsuense]GLT02388.1 TonB-dependent receptor [Sphingobium jiangsuense]